MRKISEGGKLFLLRELHVELREKNAFHGQFTCKLQRTLETWLTVWRQQTQFKKKELTGEAF